MSLDVIVLAAGKGTRLKSQLAKVLHPLFARPLLGRVLDTLKPLHPNRVIVVVGHQAQAVEAFLAAESWPFEVITVLQEPPQGTGHALQCVAATCEAQGIALNANVLVVSGDVPLIEPQTLSALLARHQQQSSALTLLSAKLSNPTGYGRVLTHETGAPLAIVEEKDASEAQKALNQVNAGIYVLNWPVVKPFLAKLSPKNAQNEYYLTDLVALAAQNQLTTAHVVLDNPHEMLGVNSRADLAQCHQLLNQRTLENLMAEGVTILSPEQTWVSPEVQIGPDTIIYPGCWLEGPVVVGKNCILGPNTVLKGHTVLEDGVGVFQSLIVNSRVQTTSQVGPFAHLRDGADVGPNVKIGNFVEMKNASIGADGFISHLSYVGDATLGEDVNVGAGAITANYNHLTKAKARMTIGDHVAIGSNAVLVAPLEVGEHAFIAAGSVITHNVEAYELAIARPKQTGLKNWVKRQLERLVSSL